MYLIKFSKQADTDKSRLKAAGLEAKAKSLLNIIQQNPFQNPPPYEKLVGNLSGNFSRRINIQHRLVYAVLENTDGYAAPSGKLYDGIILVKRMWTHYE
ncbi:addiction module toxin, Txe/YoeB family [Selenomonas sp. FOBRC6]|uniref:Txe/YoeB family addiction module toxin n=1 Tax=Selenomonas sp. FOBRC6 TaxID=936572 RepID=UPI000277EF7C|nr:Txe/YoeB family addiction module toxin [Selenomonas sp. FOBRC6]EJO23605.1 addiction module toxin, Txe/YoeB family [Selenomonas sp. FOBRC6]